jgi:hypothetical protein
MATWFDSRLDSIDSLLLHHAFIRWSAISSGLIKLMTNTWIYPKDSIIWTWISQRQNGPITLSRQCFVDFEKSSSSIEWNTYIWARQKKLELNIVIKKKTTCDNSDQHKQTGHFISIAHFTPSKREIKVLMYNQKRTWWHVNDIICMTQTVRCSVSLVVTVCCFSFSLCLCVLLSFSI